MTLYWKHADKILIPRYIKDLHIDWAAEYLKIDLWWLREIFQDCTAGSEKFYNSVKKVCLYDSSYKGCTSTEFKDYIDLIQKVFINLQKIEIENILNISNKETFDILSTQKIGKINNNKFFMNKSHYKVESEQGYFVLYQSDFSKVICYEKLKLESKIWNWSWQGEFVFVDISNSNL